MHFPNDLYSEWQQIERGPEFAKNVYVKYWIHEDTIHI